MKENKWIKLISISIVLTLFILPFLWFSPNELEMGGDSNRLFLLDPASYLKINAFYSIEPDGMGKVRPDQVLIPYLLVIDAIHSIFRSPYVTMSVLNGLKLSGSFLFLYLIVIEFILIEPRVKNRKLAHLAGILAGIFYTFSPSVGENMSSALITHNQVFLNPLMFYLMLRFLMTNKSLYIWLSLLITLIFSPNFSLKAPPPLFAYYPLAFTFLYIYVVYVLKKQIHFRKLAFGLIGFIGIHAFHIFPVIVHIFDSSSDYYSRTLDAFTGRNEGLDYFNAVRGLGKVVFHLFFNYSGWSTRWATFLPIVIIILGLIFNKKRLKVLLLLSVFFLITTYLSSANITDLGINLYRVFFYIPGFSMFRNFYGQWQWVHTFFFATLFGVSAYIFLEKIKTKYTILFSIVFIFLIGVNGWSFITGNIFRSVHPNSNNMTSVLEINPDFTAMLSFVRNISDDVSIFHFPFTDYFYEIVPGINNGAYIGLSPTSYLTGVKSFYAYQTLYPFSETFYTLIKDKKYADIHRLFGLLGVKYISYTKDPKAFVLYYPTFPYSLFLKTTPDEATLDKLVLSLTGQNVFQKGYYEIYKVPDEMFIPRIYIPSNIVLYDTVNDTGVLNTTFFQDIHITDPRIGFISRDDCLQVVESFINCQTDTPVSMDSIPKLEFVKINPTKYKLHITEIQKPFVIIFSTQMNKSWKLYKSTNGEKFDSVIEKYFNDSIIEYKGKYTTFDDQFLETQSKSDIIDQNHIPINGYANAWLIDPNIFGNEKELNLVLEMDQQRIFYYSLVISIVSIFIFILSGLFILRK